MNADSTPAFTAARYLDAIRRDGHRLIELARPRLDATVPSCPDWDMAGLLSHMGQVYNMVANLVERRATERTAADAELDDPPAGAEADWCAGLLQRAVDVLEAVDPDAPMWTWTAATTARFYHRRMAHETAVHLADAQQAAGVPVELDSALAADGIDEFVEMVYLRPRPPEHALVAPDGSLHLHRTDGDGEWMFTSGDDGTIIATSEHGKGDAAVRGSGSDLLLFIWGRGISPACEVFGDRAVADAWAALAP